MSPTPSNGSLELISFYLTRYFCIFLLIFGTFGNIFNICIFTRPKLRSISCSWYFLASTCSNLIALYMACLTRVLATFDINPQTTLQAAIYCKVRSYFTYDSLSLSIWFVIGACFDRWASSSISMNIRSINSVKTAKRVILFMLCAIYFVYGQMFYCFNGSYESMASNCYTISETCELYNSFALFLTYSIFPCCLMLIFGLLTIRNIRKSKQQVGVVPNISPVSRRKKTSTQMTVMLLVQVICSIILSLPISIQNIYNEMTRNYNKTFTQQQMEDFLSILFTLITLMNSSVSFYIFAFTGTIFRRELKCLLLSSSIIAFNMIINKNFI